MVELDWTRCKVAPFEHQKEGVAALCRYPNFALFDEMGAGKTCQVVTTASFLYDAALLDAVLVVAPAAVRSVWLKSEIEKFCFVPYASYEFHAHGLALVQKPDPLPPNWLRWVVTNYEFLRQPGRVDQLLSLLSGKRVWAVLDESSRIKSPSAQQTKACWRLGGTFKTSFREVKVVDGRVEAASGSPVVRKTILNGTPVANSPLDLYAQLRFLDPAIVGVQNFTHMRARYGVVVSTTTKSGKRFPKVVGYQHLEDLTARVKPYVLRRLKRDCLDLPEKVYQTREVALTKELWRLYRQMRDEAVATLASGDESVAFQAGVKFLRLAQLTTGFLGGVEVLGGEGAVRIRTEEVGREKLDALVELVDDLLVDDPHLKLLVWCRFRAELERAVEALAPRFAGQAHKVYGQQPRLERELALFALAPSARDATKPVLVVGIPAAGGLGLNLTAAHTVCYLTNDFSLLTRQQSEDRVHRPGQHLPCTYVDFVATGPHGERTIDHVVREALAKKEDLARWTTAQWRAALAP